MATILSADWNKTRRAYAFAVLVGLCSVILTATRTMCDDKKSAIPEKEKAAADNIKSLGAKVYLDVNGHVKMLSIGIADKATDESLSKVDFSAFSRLKVLSIKDQAFAPGKISDRSLEHIAKAPALEGITIDGVKITNKGLSGFLRKQRSLASLTLVDLPITDEAFDAFDGNETIRNVVLCKIKVSPEGFLRIRKAKNLFSMDILHAEVSDAAFAEICKTSELVLLSIENTKISDQAAKQISKLSKLRLLNLRSTGVTADREASLQKLMPKVIIHRIE